MTTTTQAPAYVSCGSCGNTNRADQTRCYNCQQPLAGASPAAGSPGASRGGSHDSAKPTPAGVESGATMRVIGWIVLVVGILVGMLMIAEFGRVEGPFGTSASNPLGVWMGMGVLGQSILWSVLSFALAAAAENSAEMRRELWELRQELRSARTNPAQSA